MIYIGVEILPHALKALALSEDYTLVDKRELRANRFDIIEKWVDSCKDVYDRKVKWFFDEKKFLQYQIATKITLTSDIHQFYLVNHHQLMNMIKYIYDYLFYMDLINPPDISFILASARRIIDERFIHLYDPDDDLPF